MRAESTVLPGSNSVVQTVLYGTVHLVILVQYCTMMKWTTFRMQFMHLYGIAEGHVVYTRSSTSTVQLRSCSGTGTIARDLI